ncbi:MAG: hypothetical protein KIH62_003905 [Candidatus Kerfeldbacteria bacterium]|nr:hypothetical protein [Candidatus Kerfeldbacteria bacterium]
MRYIKWTIFVPVLIFGLLFTLFSAGGVLAFSLPWRLFRKLGVGPKKNPGYIWVYVYYWWLRVTLFCLGVTVRIRAPVNIPAGAISILGDHGATLPLLLQALHAAVYFPLRAKITIKAQHMKNPIGIGLCAMDVGMPLQREDRGMSVGVISREVTEPCTGLIFVTGTRPTIKNIADGRAALKEMGYEGVEKLEHTPAPRPKGSWAMLQTQRAETVYLQLVASSVDDKGGLSALVDLMFGGAIFVTYEKMTVQRSDFQEFANTLVRYWLKRVNPWIGEKRAFWGSLSPSQRREELFKSLRTILRG